jgi:hypothetical protein
MQRRGKGRFFEEQCTVERYLRDQKDHTSSMQINKMRFRITKLCVKIETPYRVILKFRYYGIQSKTFFPSISIKQIGFPTLIYF